MAIAVAALIFTQSGTEKCSADWWPDTISASVITPIVFWASFVPWVKATKPPETSWRRRKTLFTGPGARFWTTHNRTVISAAASNSPRPAPGATE